jgi:hypothetical protein
VDQVIGTEEQGKKGERLHGTENKERKRNKKVAIKPLLPVLTVLCLDIDSPTPHSPSWL